MNLPWIGCYLSPCLAHLSNVPRSPACSEGHACRARPVSRTGSVAGGWAGPAADAADAAEADAVDADDEGEADEADADDDGTGLARAAAAAVVDCSN